MIFDTDIFIWIFRGSKKAAKLIDSTKDRRISVITHMELVNEARIRQELKNIKSFLRKYSIMVELLSENIGHRASGIDLHRGIWFEERDVYYRCTRRRHRRGEQSGFMHGKSQTL